MVGQKMGQNISRENYKNSYHNNDQYLDDQFVPI